MKKSLWLIRAGSDPRIPRSAIGYIADLADSGCSREIEIDRLAQLARYVPDLVAEYEQA